MPSTATTLTLGRHKLNVSNLDKVLYQRTGFTKGQVIQYYIEIAGAIIPHLTGRPLTLKRYPNGVDSTFFYEKNCPVHRPEWLPTENRPSSHRSSGINYCVIDAKPGLVWVANLASLELHVLLSRGKDSNRPTHMVFDLDPGPGMNVLDCAKVGFQFRDMLQQLGLQSFVKTSGSKGLHLYVPLNTPVTFEQTKAFSHAMAALLEKQCPKQVTSVMRKDVRDGRIFIDWSQNDEHKTTVCVYSLRAKDRPSVSTPVTWDELQAAVKKNDPDRLVFPPDTAVARFQKLGDLFEPVLKVKQKLPAMQGT